MAPNDNVASPVGGNDAAISLGREKLPQYPDLEPLHLADNPEQFTIPTTAETLRKIFNDKSLSPEEQDGFVESILAIVRKQPGDPALYGHGESEAEYADDFKILNQILEEISTTWINRVKAGYSDDISSDSSDSPIQQTNENTVQGTNSVTDMHEEEEEQVINSDDEHGPPTDINSIGPNSLFGPDEENFQIWEQLEMEAEFAWLEGLGRDILPEHFALFKCCFAQRILHCSNGEKEALGKILATDQVGWLAKPLPEDSGIKMPEREQVWVVIWSVMKFARLLLRAGGGAIKDNKYVREYVTIMLALGWLVGDDPFDYISRAQKSPEIYMSADGWITSKEFWVEGAMDKLGGLLDGVCDHAKAGKKFGNNIENGENNSAKSDVEPGDLEPEEDDDRAVIAARDELIAGIVEEVLMNTTRNVNRWAKFIKEKWSMQPGGIWGQLQGPVDAT
ncbi:hypothetical protein TWF281_008207 [Arthrobotrys megalospora]